MPTARGSFTGTKNTFKGRFWLSEGIEDLEGRLTADLEDFSCRNATITYDDVADPDGICDIPVLTHSFIGIDLFEVALKSYTTGGVAKFSANCAIGRPLLLDPVNGLLARIGEAMASIIADQMTWRTAMRAKSH